MPGSGASLVVVANQKGGVGKTTVSVQLAASLSRRLRVLLVDVDPQQSAAWWAENAGSNLQFDYAAMPAPAEIVRLRELGARYDIILIDTPGSLEDSRTLEAVLDVADFAIVPLPPEQLAVNPTIRTIERHIAPRRVPYAVLLNRIDPRVAGQLREWEQFLDTHLGIPRLQAYLRQYRAHTDAAAAGVVVTSSPDNRRTAGAIWDATCVAFELVGRLAPARIAG